MTTEEHGPVLAARGVSRNFGGVQAVRSVDLSVIPGRFHCVIGSNGAGKTTLFDVLVGVYPPSSGTVSFEGRTINRWSVNRRARAGIVRTFQNPRPINSLSVRENVALASAVLSQRHSMLRLASGRDADWKAVDEALNMCMLDRWEESPDTLSHGGRKRLELAMALVCLPRVLLLDEPTAGMTIPETAQMAGLLRQLGQTYCMVVIEHDLGFVKSTAEYVTVMHRGEVLCEGTPEQIEQDERVRGVYLGAER